MKLERKKTFFKIWSLLRKNGRMGQLKFSDNIRGVTDTFGNDDHCVPTSDWKAVETFFGLKKDHFR